MSRLFDDVRAHLEDGVGQDVLSRCVVTDITNVAHYWANSDMASMGNDYPPYCVPPFSSGFYEFRVPKTFLSNGNVFEVGIADQVARLGVCVSGFDVHTKQNENSEDTKRMIDEWIDISIRRLPPDEAIKHRDNLLRCRWLLAGLVITMYDNKPLEFGSMIFGIYPSGTASSISIVMSNVNDEAISETIDWVLSFALDVSKLAWSFMNCKNVVRILNTPPAAANKQRARTGRAPLVKYYTLNIEPLSAVVRREGGANHGGIEKALHICRGHFATYDEKPLFGKIKGTFWVPQHMRGKGAHGVIAKDYKIKPVSNNNKEEV